MEEEGDALSAIVVSSTLVYKGGRIWLLAFGLLWLFGVFVWSAKAKGVQQACNSRAETLRGHISASTSGMAMKLDM